MKLELKHLAPYLPYALRIKDANTTFEMTGSFLDEWFNYGSLPDIKPILKPLTEFQNWNTLLHPDDVYEIIEGIAEDSLEYIRRDLFQKLVENHFDVFNLIPEGLAIDINTLKS